MAPTSALKSRMAFDLAASSLLSFLLQTRPASKSISLRICSVAGYGFACRCARFLGASVLKAQPDRDCRGAPRSVVID